MVGVSNIILLGAQQVAIPNMDTIGLSSDTTQITSSQ